MSLYNKRFAISLSELCGKVKNTLLQEFSDFYWVRAELSEVHPNKNGHCYLELIDKEENTNLIKAKIRGVIFANKYPFIKAYFEENTHTSFSAGIDVLLQVSLNFNEVYGMSLLVHDIDPTFTVGSIVRRRMEILKQLEEEGVLYLNKELSIPSICKRIAIISSPTAAGYGDFYKQLTNNQYNFHFEITLFSATMQGEQTEKSIISALEKIYTQSACFDVVVILRGGGATSDLNSFDTYLLAASCAQFPLPIIVGIGHDRDTTVLDSVASVSLKTPTAVATWLIERMLDVFSEIKSIESKLLHAVDLMQSRHKEKIKLLQAQIKLKTIHKIEKQKLYIDRISDTLPISVKNFLHAKYTEIQHIEKYIDLISPQNILKRGYALISQNGKVMKKSTDINKQESLLITLMDSSLQVRVIESENNNISEK